MDQKQPGREATKPEKRREPRTGTVARRVNTTLGDLIAAAFDTLGNEVKSVAQLVSSSDMARVIGKRIVLL